MSDKKETSFGIGDLIPFLMFVAAVAFFVGAVMTTYQDESAPTEKAGSKSRYDFTTQAYELPSVLTPGETIEFGGPDMSQPVLINFFASWCEPCKVEHSVLMEISEKIDIRFIGIAFNETPEATKAFLDDLGNPFTQVAIDDKLRVATGFGVSGIPVTFLIGSDGRVLWGHEGPVTDLETPVEDIRATLSEKREE